MQYLKMLSKNKINKSGDVYSKYFWILTKITNVNGILVPIYLN